MAQRRRTARKSIPDADGIRYTSLMKSSKLTTIRVALHQEDDGSYWAESADAPGCFTVGDTIDETLRNMQDAIRTHFELPKQASIRTLTDFSAKLSLV